MKGNMSRFYDCILSVVTYFFSEGQKNNNNLYVDKAVMECPTNDDLKC